MDNNVSEKLAARQDYISRIYHAARVKKLLLIWIRPETGESCLPAVLTILTLK